MTYLSETGDNNQLDLVNTNTIQKSSNPTPKETGRNLNPAAPMFTPSSPGNRPFKEINATKEDNNDEEKEQKILKETTAQ